MDVLGFDKEILIFLNSLGSNSWDWFWKAISYPATWLPFYAILLFFFYKKYNLKHFLILLLIISIGILFSDQLCNLFKNNIERLRPCHDPNLQNIIRIVECKGKFGFYSGHSSNSFFIANFTSILLLNSKNQKILIFFWASLVACSRVYLGVHFPLDILMGATMGFLIGGLFSEVFIFFKNKTLL